MKRSSLTMKPLLNATNMNIATNITIKLLTSLLISLLIAACEQADNINTSNNKAEQSSISKQVTVIDFKGRKVSLNSPAKRIVALAPHVVENVFSAGAGDKLVGVVSYSDFPEQATKLPIVGGYAKTNLEKILELQPDLVIAWESGNSDSSLERIQELGFPVYIDQPDKLDDVGKSIKDIGTLAGTSEVANKVANDYLKKVEIVRAKKLHQQPVSAFYQVWNSPLRTINGGHIISDAIELCGGVNIYANESAVAPVINIESILERNPESIIASGMSDSRPEWLDEWKEWPSLNAVKKDNLFFVDPDHIQRHTVRILFGIESICRQLDVARQKRINNAVDNSKAPN